MGDLEWRPRRDGHSDYRQRPFRQPLGGKGGRKRGREEPEESPEQIFVREVMDLGDENAASGITIEKQLEDYLPRLHREIKCNPELVKEILLACAVELSTKTPQYATLIGFLNVEDEEFVEQLISKANDEFNESLKTADRPRARLLLRLFAALVVSNVLLPSSVVELLDTLMSHALSIMESAESSRQSWQLWTDYLVSIILLALPWGGSELVDSAPSEFSSLFEKVEKYVGKRPVQNDVTLRPFMGPIKEDDPAARSDSGGASFVAELWSAVQDLRDNSSWKCQSVTRLSETIEHKLAAGHPIPLPKITQPDGPPKISDEMPLVEQAAVLNSLFPPRGGICLLDPVHTQGDLPVIEKIVLEEYILDTLHFFHQDRVACAQRLASSIPSPYPISTLLAEVLFSQMLTLPKPPLKPVAYGMLMVNLCQGKFPDLGPFPRGLSGCVRELFSRMPALDPTLFNRLAEWLSFHLSNLNFIWPWQKWKRVLEAPEYDLQRLFIRSTLKRLVDLSYLGHVRENIDSKEFHSLLPPPLGAKPIFPASSSLVIKPEEPVTDADCKKEPKDVEMKEKSPPEEDKPADEEQHSPALLLTNELALLFKKKEKEGDVLSWMKEKQYQETHGGQGEALQATMHAILIAGSRSITHTTKVMERYANMMKTLSEGCLKSCLIDTVADVWQSSTLRICLILEKMISVELLSGEDIIEWAFSSPGIASVGTGEEVLKSWDLIECAVNHEVGAVSEAHDEVARAEISVKHAENAAQHAAHVAADAAERVEHGDGDNEVMVNRITSANREESMALEDVEHAVAIVAEKKACADNAQSRQQAVLLKVFQCFARMFHQQPLPEDDTEANKSELRLFYRSLAHLASFCRAHSQYSADLLGQLQDEIFAEGKVVSVARAVFLRSMRLGLNIETDEAVYDISLFVKKKGVEKESAQVDDKVQVTDDAFPQEDKMVE